MRSWLSTVWPFWYMRWICPRHREFGAWGTLTEATHIWLVSRFLSLSRFLSFPGVGSQDLKLETSYMLSQGFFFPSHKNDRGPGVQIGVRKRGTTEISGQ